jgi:hypothetical protein
MTALVLTTDIPSNIVTIEQLVTWANKCLWQLYPGINATEGENYTQRAISSGEFYVSATNVIRHIGRQSLEMMPESKTGPLKSWMYVRELGTLPLTTAMKTN